MQPQRIARFEVTRLLGEGGMGVVYEARDPDLDRAVAVKLIHEQDPQQSIRLLREAQALARLQHPNVVGVHEVGRHGEQVFVAMERVDGVSLDRLDPKPADWREVLRLFIQAGRGLAAAHDKGLIHRDVKPHNILVDRDGRVRVADFGLVRLADAPTAAGAADEVVDPHKASPTATTVEDTGDPLPPSPVTPGAGALGSALTRANAYMGTPRYMAPEQHERKPATPASDQFSFCVSLWETLFGEHPFERDPDVAWAAAVTADHRRPAPRGKAPPWLVAALDRGLARNPAKRHPSMTALVDLLERTPQRRRRIVAVGATMAIAAAGATAAFLLARDRASTIDCARASESLDELWNPSVRARIESKLGAEAGTAIDAKATAWAAARVEACQATHERGQQTGDLLDRRTACFDRSALELRSLLAAIETGSVPAWRALEAARGLPDAGRCDGAVLAGTQRPVGSPAATEAEQLLADANTESRLGRGAAARATAEGAVAAARNVGDPRLLAEALRAHGSAVMEIDHVKARALLEEALGHAAAAGDPTTEAWVALDLLDQASREELQPRIEALLPVATAALRRARTDRGLTLEGKFREAYALTVLGRDDDALRACDELTALGSVKAFPCRCTAMIEAGRVDDSIGACEANLAAAAKEHGEQHPDYATALTNLADALGNAGNYKRSLDLLARALAIDERTGGETSQSFQRDLGALAGISSLAEKHGDALAAANRGLALLERTPGQTDTFRAQLLQARSSANLQLGNIEAGRRDAADALAAGLHAYGADHPKLVMYHIHVAQSHRKTDSGLGTDDCATAIESFDRAAALARRVSPRSEVLLVALQGSATCHIQQGHPAQAKPLLEESLTLANTIGMSPYNRAMLHGAYSDLLLNMGDRPGARREMQQVRELLAAIPEAAPMLKQVDAMLKQLQ